jgi:hypothetical protein
MRPSTADVFKSRIEPLSPAAKRLAQVANLAKKGHIGREEKSIMKADILQEVSSGSGYGAALESKAAGADLAKPRFGGCFLYMLFVCLFAKSADIFALGCVL